jgi:hypothetical protein
MKMKSHSNKVSNEDIWKAYVEFVASASAAMLDASIETVTSIMLNRDGVDVVADILGVPREKVNSLVDDMLDPVWSRLYVYLIFPLERAWRGDNDMPKLEEKLEDRYVYLMRDPFTNLYKIGFSINPEERLRGINRVIPPGGTKVELVHLFVADKAREAEQALHHVYDEERVALEWFELDREDVRSIKAIDRYENGTFYTKELRLEIPQKTPHLIVD